MNRGIIVILICGLLFGSSLIPLFHTKTIATSTFTENESVLIGVSPDGKGWLADYNGQLVLFVSGSGYEMGYQQGYLLKDEIRRSINGYVYGGNELNGNPPDTLQALYTAQEPYIPQRFKDEMQGMSDASGIPLIDIHVYNVKSDSDVFGCRQIVLWGDATSNGDLHHWRSLGYPITFRDDASGVAMQDHALVIIAKPRGYFSFTNIAWPGSVGGVTGMNEQGISLAVNSVISTNMTINGCARTFRLRKVLEEANCIDDAVTILNESKTVGWCMCLADGKIPEAYAVEMNGERLYAGPWDDPVESYNADCVEKGFPPYEPLEGCVIRFGHMYRDPILAETRISPKTGEQAGFSCQSLCYYEHMQYILEYYGEATANLLNGLLYELADPVASNLHIAVFSPSTLQFKASNAIGSTPAQHFSPYSMDLEVLVNKDIPSIQPEEIPSVTISSPHGGRQVKWFQNKITIQGEAYDDQGIVGVYVKVDGQDYEQASGTDTWDHTIDTSYWDKNSWHRIKVIAIDETGYGDIDIIGLKKGSMFTQLLLERFSFLRILMNTEWFSDVCDC